MVGWFLCFFDSDLREKCLKFFKMFGMLLFTSPLENTFSTTNIQYNCFYLKLSHSSFSGVPITVMPRCICWKYWQFMLIFFSQNIILFNISLLQNAFKNSHYLNFFQSVFPNEYIIMQTAYVIDSSNKSITQWKCQFSSWFNFVSLRKIMIWNWAL